MASSSGLRVGGRVDGGDSRDHDDDDEEHIYHEEEKEDGEKH